MLDTEHLETCTGCEDCDQMMAFYQTCDDCGRWGHNSTMNIVEVIDGAATVVCDCCRFEREKAVEK